MKDPPKRLKNGSKGLDVWKVCCNWGNSPGDRVVPPVLPKGLKGLELKGAKLEDVKLSGVKLGQ
ncbi:hypothetical protein H6G52_09985 [Limnothrix sp. FACHB-881]|uniref:hypothetical protein n=1 Tax=Limnothrix sp. FACHB-881 TaxID=2692819 RepID=UPI0016827A31|nr:hypothetical protein [Limnothrix sp. FACHB-881]MBD2635689.1 hypothetical protein [Limnothrix sp. FACHB-881]